MSINKLERKWEEKIAPKIRDSFRSIMKSTSTLSMGTIASRILGFFRDVILARLLGTGFRADAFFVALKIPNLLRDIVGEGATNSAVVPVLSEYAEKKNKEEFWRFVSVLLILGLILLSLITILGIIFAPVIVRILAPGFIAEPQKLHLTIQLTKIVFPYLVFIGLTAYCFGILYTFHSFFVPAFSPCLLNIALIAAAVVASKSSQEPVFILAIGVLAGGILQLAVQFGPLKKTGFRLIKPKTLAHPGALKIGKLLLPRVFGSAVYQLTVFIDTFCASLSHIVGAGGISAIYYANRIIQFPMGVFSVAMASAALPSLSAMVNRKDMDGVKSVIVFALENIFFIMCPTTVILLFLSTPIIRVLFEHGEFTSYSTKITSEALAYSAIGLFSFGGIKILVTAFHALQDTKTPVKVAALCLLMNASLNFALMGPLKVGGIALASSIAGTVDFLILFYFIEKKLGSLKSELFLYFSKVTFAAGITGLAVYFMWLYIPLANETAKLIFIGAFGFILYGIVCLQINIIQAHKIFKYLKKWLTLSF